MPHLLMVEVNTFYAPLAGSEVGGRDEPLAPVANAEQPAAGLSVVFLDEAARAVELFLDDVARKQGEAHRYRRLGLRAQLRNLVALGARPERTPARDQRRRRRAPTCD